MNQYFIDYVIYTDDGCNNIIVRGNCFAKNNSDDIDVIVLLVHEDLMKMNNVKKHQIIFKQFNKVLP